METILKKNFITIMKIKDSTYDKIALSLLLLDAFFHFYDSNLTKARFLSAIAFIIIFRKKLLNFHTKTSNKSSDEN